MSLKPHLDKKSLWQDIFILGIFAVLCFLLLNYLVRDPEKELLQETMREQFEEMSVEDKQRLQQKMEWFEKLDAAEQERIRSLHDSISSDKNSEELNRVMRQYYQWLKSLQPGERAELLQLKGDARIAKIQQLQKKQREREFRQNEYSEKREDIKKIGNWMKDYTKNHHEEILVSIIKTKKEGESYRAKFEKYRLDHQHRKLMFHKFGAVFDFRNPRPLDISQEEINQLAISLSTTAQKKYKKAKTAKEKQQIVRWWITDASRYLFWKPQGRRSLSDEKLQEFMKTLSETQQHKLRGLSPEDLRRRLSQLYHQHRGRRNYNRQGHKRPKSNGTSRHRPGGRGKKTGSRKKKEKQPN